MKHNVKIFIFGFIACLFLVMSINIFASLIYRAEDISYTNITSKVTNVKDAIDELYTDINTPLINKIDWTVTHNYAQGYRQTNRETSINLSTGNYIVFLTYEFGINNSSVLNNANFDKVLNQLEFNLSNEQSSCEMIDGFFGTSTGSKLFSTAKDYAGYSTNQNIYKCSIVDDTEVKIVAKSSYHDQVGQILTLYSIKIE